MTTIQQTDDSAWILKSLFLGRHQRYRPQASLVLGLAGPALFAILSCAVVGLLAVWLEAIPPGSITRMIAGLLVFLFAAGSYVAALLTLHLFASCQLPISIRLAMIYATIFLCWLAAVWSSGESVTSIQVLCTVPLCLGGFIARRFRRWRAVSWNQPLEDPKLTIFSLLDVTAAIALTLGMLTAGNELDLRGLACFVPSAVILALFGIHVWARLLFICPVGQYAGSGFGIWMAVNVLLAFLIFVSAAVSFSSAPAGLLGFIVAPAALLVAHVWTELPLRWLRGCGWTLVRIDRTGGLS